MHRMENGTSPSNRHSVVSDLYEWHGVRFSEEVARPSTISHRSKNGAYLEQLPPQVNPANPKKHHAQNHPGRRDESSATQGAQAHHCRGDLTDRRSLG